MKRNTKRKLLRCKSQAHNCFEPHIHVLTSRTRHSFTRHTVQATLCKHSKYNRCQFAFSIVLCFQQHSYFKLNSLRTDAIKKSLKCMNETKNHYKKVFTLHYWRFFWFKYLFSLFCITLICLWSFLLGNIMLRRIHRVKGWSQGREGEGLRLNGKREIQPYTHTHPLCTLDCIHVYELACA